MNPAQTHSSFYGSGERGEILEFKIHGCCLTLADGSPVSKDTAKQAVFRLWAEVQLSAERLPEDYPGKRCVESHPVTCGLVADIEACVLATAAPSRPWR